MSKKIEKDDISYFQDYGVHIPTRTLYMGGEEGIDANMSEKIIKGLHILDNVDDKDDKPIVIIMNNPGGDLTHTMAIYDAIKTCKNYVTIKVYGEASSGGSIILQAADERILSENSEMLIHYGSSSFEGNSLDVIKFAEVLRKELDRMEKIYLEKIKQKNPKFRKSEIVKMLTIDTTIKPKDAIKLGLADKILKRKKVQ